MRLLVIGGSGLVGSHVVAEALGRAHEVLGTYRTHPGAGLVHLDLASPEEVVRVIDDWKPTAVIHAAGWTWVDGCEDDPARAHRENAEQPAWLARLCRNRRIRFVYVSTSYVFDGNEGPYTENDRPNPINAYARSKFAGERRVMEEADVYALVPRVICVWGREVQKKNFVYQVAAAVNSGRMMKIPSDQCGNPSWAGDIAAWIIDLLQRGASGIWHLGGEGGESTREQWLRQILKGLRVNPAFSGAVDRWTYQAIATSELQQKAIRPLKAGLSTARIQSFCPRKTRAPDALDCIYD